MNLCLHLWTHSMLYCIGYPTMKENFQQVVVLVICNQSK